MSKRTRRRKRAAVAKARREHADAMRGRYYRTPVKRDCRCAACGRRLRAGRHEMVFRKLGSVALCVECADRDPLVDYRLSYVLEEQRARERSRSRRHVRLHGDE
jgi:hypothetical protein